jgi:hypothetical protein
MGRTLRMGIAAALLAGGAASLAAVPAGADQAAVAASGCIATVTRLQALDLQEPPQDEVYLIFGDSRFPSSGSVTFTNLLTRPGSQLGNPAKFVPAGERVTLAGREADFPSPDDSLGSAGIGCGSPPVVDLHGSMSVYRAWMSYTLVP